ncbi:hypothetical protein DPMN_079977 [Dreissena polymorpha]|uniref:Ig-like domain-containing protein n=1 Tax=Dreissena polymorpha TaxID=45954 RepID=A0A9D3YRR9_DREPO|nr:hypothetical protein DPMN_079977 [Dreissena polymorpha]
MLKDKLFINISQKYSCILYNHKDGPELLTLSPSNISYTLDENQRLNDITCSATCSPVQCTYEWRKSEGGAVSSSGVLSLGTLERGEAGTYTCTASNPGSAATTSSQQIAILVRCKFLHS